MSFPVANLLRAQARSSPRRRSRMVGDGCKPKVRVGVHLGDEPSESWHDYR